VRFLLDRNCASKDAAAIIFIAFLFHGNSLFTSFADDASWSSANMKQYFRKHQMLEPINESVTDWSTMPFAGENHSTSGTVRTSFNEWRLPTEDNIIKGL
jgi:hypothetical protein